MSPFDPPRDRRLSTTSFLLFTIGRCAGRPSPLVQRQDEDDRRIVAAMSAERGILIADE